MFDSTNDSAKEHYSCLMSNLSKREQAISAKIVYSKVGLFHCFIPYQNRLYRQHKTSPWCFINRSIIVWAGVQPNANSVYERFVVYYPHCGVVVRDTSVRFLSVSSCFMRFPHCSCWADRIEEKKQMCLLRNVPNFRMIWRFLGTSLRVFCHLLRLDWSIIRDIVSHWSMFENRQSYEEKRR